MTMQQDSPVNVLNSQHSPDTNLYKNHDLRIAGQCSNTKCGMLVIFSLTCSSFCFGVQKRNDWH